MANTGISSVTFKIINIGEYLFRYVFFGISGENYSTSADEYLGRLPLDWCWKAEGYSYNNCNDNQIED